MKRIISGMSLALVLLATGLSAQDGPKVLVVTAHPDDEAVCAAAVYKITHDLNGTVDLALVTNGEGGYKYATLSEAIYNLPLTDEETGRAYLPAIRKKELMDAGAITGIRNFFFLDQKDHRYTQDVEEVLNEVWETNEVVNRLAQIVKSGGYEFVFTLLPVKDTHGHHKGAAIVTLRAVGQLGADRPIVLGCTVGEKDSTATRFAGLDGYPETAIRLGAPVFSFDRTQNFGYNDRLNYKIIVNWVIAAHKSQGTMQLLMNRGDVEQFFYYDLNSDAGIDQTEKLFEALSIIRYPQKAY